VFLRAALELRSVHLQASQGGPVRALVAGRPAHVIDEYGTGVVVRYGNGQRERIDYADGRLLIDPTDAQIGILTLAEAARYLELAPATLRRQVNNGRFAATLVGKTYVTSRSEVERYRAQSRGRPGRRAKETT
jgi:excisionase family DNA binding protein